MRLPLPRLEQETAREGRTDGVDLRIRSKMAAQNRAALGRRDLHRTVVLQQVRAEVVRQKCCVLGAVAGSALACASSERTGLRHDYKMAIVADPGTGRVRRAEAFQF